MPHLRALKKSLVPVGIKKAGPAPHIKPFLLLIGVTLIADGLGQHISKGYIYFAMAFSVFVEMINIKIRTKRSKPVVLKEKNL